MSHPTKYRKKPVEVEATVEAMPVTEHNLAEVAAWCGGKLRDAGRMPPHIAIPIPKGGTTLAFVGDYVLSDGGRFYPQSRGGFEATYEPVQSTSEPQGEPRRWKLWRIDRGEGAEVWQGAEGPATNPPDDCGLTGIDWAEAATVEVVEVQPPAADRIEAIADVLFGSVSLEDEDGKPAPREHYIDLARQVAALASELQEGAGEPDNGQGADRDWLESQKATVETRRSEAAGPLNTWLGGYLEALSHVLARSHAGSQPDQGQQSSLAERIKAELRSESDENTGLAGPLGEAIATAAGSYSLEFVTPEQLAEGICNWLDPQPHTSRDGGEGEVDR
jgi:hypothetical protein